MGSALLSSLQNFWPFYLLKEDDLKASNRLVNRLSVAEHTKQFVFAIRDQDSHAVVYLLVAENLSKQSAIDADILIREVRPNAVVVSVSPSTLPEIQVEGKCLSENYVNNIPTSSFGVLKRCLVEKIKRDQYDSFAGCEVLQAIFGIGFYGHFFAAKAAAEKVDSHFLLLESPYEMTTTMNVSTHSEAGNESSRLLQQTNCLLPEKVTSAMYSCSRRFLVADALQSHAVKSLIPSLKLLIPSSISDSTARNNQEGQPAHNYQIPSFAQSVFYLLVDLHEIFKDIPAIGKALSSAQNILASVNAGEPVDTQTLSEVQNFRIAIEGLRIALNKAAHSPIGKLGNATSSGSEFSELPTEEKCHVLFAQALKVQAGSFGTVVAIVDAACLSGLRRHWNTSLPPDVADLANHCITHYCDSELDNGEETLDYHVKQRALTDKPVVALGAGATAILGVSSLSKAAPASSLLKIATVHVPSLKVGLIQLQRTAAIGLGKILVPSKLLAPGHILKTSAVKFTASAEKIRAVTHAVIATAERTSLLAIRTSFYEIMRRRHANPVRFAPWASFGCSMSACAGLLMYGDGIECAAESLPSVPMIASLGRGLQSLQQASQEVKQTSDAKIHEALQTLKHFLKVS
ncbi:hypothetical protein AXF42_Ash010032 [Apostasia shenzhenica]|uniref:Uncharacterized protein n=1 Tax=Apostasia shenzhenica TaxID=1088818 RepID=A0A2I0ACL8_9ASPA|nr:hypothetical protein AXF42_Ash010032 [Apostasia shenzhenica]